MNDSLADWLADNREILLSRWAALLETTPHTYSGNGHAAKPIAAESVQFGVATPPDERPVLLISLYDGLVSAAHGDHRLLDDCLRRVQAFRAYHEGDELPQLLALATRLRRLTAQTLADSRGGSQKSRAVRGRMLEELDDLFEYTIVSMASHWASTTNTVRRELDETKLLVESLYYEAEAADQTTLHVSTLNQIIQGLSATLDPDQQVAIVGEQVLSAFEMTHLTIWLFDQATGRLNAKRHWNAGRAEVPNWSISTDRRDDLTAQAYQRGEFVIEGMPNADAQGTWYQPDCAVMAVPLLAPGHTIGVVTIQHTIPERLLDRAQHDFIMSVAGQAAIALENARLYTEVRGFNAVLEQRIAERTQELQRERDMLQTLHDIALEVSSTLDLNVLLDGSLRALANLVDVTQGSIMLIDPDTEQLVHRAVLGERGDVGITRFPMGQGIVGWVAQNRKPALVADVGQDARWVQLPDDMQRKNSGALIAVPLIAQHDTLGVLLLSHDDVGYFNEGHLRLLSASAGEIALGIHNALLFDQIERQLMHQGEMRRRQEEENSQSTAILQSLSDGVVVCNADGAVLAANPAVERILERPIEELVIWNLPELFKRLLGRRAAEVPVEDLLQRPTSARNEPRHFSATFQIGPRVINVNLGPVLMSNGHLMGAVAVFRDITREVESDRLKTEFIGTVSHELRTPMTSIKGFTQLLAMGSLGPINDTQKEFLQTIQSNAERMISIINDLLDITKIETGSIELEMRPLHLAETLSNVVAELQPQIAAREHELAINIPPGLPLVRADAKRFNQILLNLLSNAVKYTPRGGKIIFEAREAGYDVVPEGQREGLKVEGRYVQIDICDTGVGIAPEDQERIFERFYRTENPLKIEAGGTGLGLSLVHPLIELLSGRIWLRSVPGEGSTFSLVIPAA